MSEIKKTLTLTNAAAIQKSSSLACENSAGPTVDLKSAPALTPFAPKSTSAITLGKGVNPPVSIIPLVQALLEGGVYYSYPIRTTQQLIVLSSDRSTIEGLRSQFPAAVESSTLEVPVPLTTGPTNFFQMEGRALLLEGIKKPRDVLIHILPSINRKGSLERKELVPLLDAAHQRCHTVIVVFQGLSPEDTACLNEYFGTVLNIEVCEPDLGYGSAFTVAPAPGTLLAAIGKRPVIDNIRVNGAGQIERSHYECVSPNAMNREIAKLIEQGKTYTEIAALYEVNKTTIMRRVDSMPFLRKGRGDFGPR